MHTKQITIVVGVIRNEKGEILLARRHQPDLKSAHGKWEFPGGGIEFRETPEEALVREVREEIGLNVEIVRLIPKIFSEIQQQSSGEVWQIIICSYECKILSGQLKAGLEEEISELKYFAPSEIKTLDAFRNIYETVKLLN